MNDTITGTTNEKFANDSKKLNRATDRCDGTSVVMTLDGSESRGGCRAQAHIKVENALGLDLLFCGHHFREYELDLTAQGFSVTVDTRASLTEHNKLIGSEN